MTKSYLTLIGLAAGALALSTVVAEAGSCKTYGAKATSGNTKDAKWYVMETIVQQVSWGLWPGWVANGKTPGYKVSGERYKCKKSGHSVTCIGQATFCITK